MKIAVIGAGALGTFYGAMIAASHEDTTLVCRERDVETLKKGITVTGDVEKSAHRQGFQSLHRPILSSLRSRPMTWHRQPDDYSSIRARLLSSSITA